MTTLGVMLLVFVALAGIGLLIMQPVLASYTQNYMMRIRYSRDIAAANKPIEAKPTSLTGLCKMIGLLILGAFPKLRNTSMKQTLIEANFRSPDHIAVLTGAKALSSTFFGLMIASQGTTSSTLMAVVVAFFGWTIPNFSVQGKAKKRKQQLLIELPTLLDLIAVCAKAGLGLMACLDRVAKDVGETCPIMKEELDLLLTDCKIFGRPMRMALKDLAERCGVEELENLVAALTIADQKGADISSTLKKQSESIRERIKRKAEEQLSTAPVKMVPIIIMFVLPLMLIPTLGPPVMQLVDTLTKMTGGMQ
jgi:tight adherence protein C